MGNMLKGLKIAEAFLFIFSMCFFNNVYAEKITKTNFNSINITYVLITMK